MKKSKHLKLLLLLLCGLFSTAHAQQNIHQLERQLESQFPVDGRGKGTGYKQARRALEVQSLHTDAEGNVLNGSVINQRELDLFMSQVQANYKANFTNAEWYSTGGDNVQYSNSGNRGGLGRVNCLAVDPSNPSTFYAGTPAGGLWKTTDNMNSWTPLTDGMVSIGVSGVVVDPQNSNRIFILTGDGDGKDSYCSGVMKSEDGGLNWSATGLTFNESQLERGYAIIMDPTNPDHMVASTWDGVYTTFDAWETWTFTDLHRCYDLEFKPGDSETVYLVHNHRVRVSSDGGLTFPITNDIVMSTPTQNLRIELAVTPANPNMVLAVVGDRNNGFMGLFISTDSGQSWSVRSSASSAGAILQAGCTQQGCLMSANETCQANYDLALAIRPNSTSRCEVGAVNIWNHDNTQNAQNSWTIRAYWDPTELPVGADFVHADIHELIYIGNVLYACSDSGIFKSTDYGVNWTYESEGMRITQFYDLDTPFNDASVSLGGAQDNGFNIIDSDNPSVFNHLYGGDGMKVHYNTDVPSIVMLCKQNGRVYLSYDGGATIASTSYQPPNGALFHSEMEVVMNSMSFWMGAIDGLYFHNGSTWDFFSSAIDSISHIAITPSDASVIYFTDGQTVRRNEVTYDANYTDAIFQAGSGAWINNGLPGTDNISRLETNAENSNQLLVLYSGYDAPNKVFISWNKGDSYTNISDNLPNVPVLCAAFEPGNDSGIFLGTDIGVFYRDLSEGEWMLFNNGLPRVPIRDLDTVSDGTLKAATFGRGIWATAIPSSCPENLILTQLNDPSNQNYTGIQAYQANGTIQSTRIITGGPGTNVRYQSNGEIILTPGFQVDGNCIFNAIIAPCGTTYELEQ
ncbi:MAG: hypothetical protein KDC12_06200 [Flavobacteriales bacterium]|nr:hypothetical protein [Flavobacteriales bacterium]